MTSYSDPSSSMAQLLALLNGSGALNSQAGMNAAGQGGQPTPNSGLAGLAAQMQGNPYETQGQYYMPQQGRVPGMPMGTSPTPQSSQMGAGSGMNIMAILQGLDPQTRMKLMMQMGLIPQGPASLPPGMQVPPGTPAQPMPMNADPMGVRG